MIDDLEIFGKLKIHLIMKMNFVSSIRSLEYCQMYPKKDNSDIMRGFGTDEIIEELF